MHEVGRPSGRALAVVVAVAALVALAVLRPAEPLGIRQPYWARELAAALPGGGPGCGTGAPGRSTAAPAGSARLTIGAYGYYGPDPRAHEPERYTVSAHLAPGPEPLRLSALRAAVDIYGPHGRGRTASARDLAVRVVTGPASKPVRPGRDGTYRFTRGDDLHLAVELPAAAVCPGDSLSSLNTCDPPRTNQIEDCPVVRLALTAHGLPGGRLVTVSFEPDARDA